MGILKLYNLDIFRKKFNQLQTMKNSIKILLLCLVILFTGCHSDDAQLHEHGQGDSGIKEKMISFDELRSMPKALAIIERINNNNNNDSGTIARRDVYNMNYGFIIDTDNILMIENGKAYHSLTFPVIDTEMADDKLRNLVLSIQDDGSYSASLYTYDLTPEEEVLIQNGAPTLISNPVQWTDLPELTPESILAARRQLVNITELVIVNCSANKHHSGNMDKWHECDASQPPGFYLITRTVFIEIAEDEGLPGGGGGETGGGGGGSTTQPINIPPLDPADIESVKGYITKPIPIVFTAYQNFYMLLNDYQKDALSYKPVKEALINFLNANKNGQHNYTDDSIAFAKNILDFCVMHSEAEYITSLVDFAMQDKGNIAIAQQMLDFLNADLTEERVEIMNEMVDVLNSNDEADINAVKMTLVASNNNYLNTEFNQNYYDLISPYMTTQLATTGGGVDYAIWATYFKIQCAILRTQNPGWSNIKIYWEASKEMVHLALDIVGLVPVVGEVADLTNGIIYTIEGDGLNATLSFTAMIPVAGIGATTVKLAKKTIAITPAVKTTLIWHKNAQNLYTFGNRSQLRKILKLAKGDSRQAHHIIPWGKSNHPAIQKAAGSSNAFHMNEAINGIPLNTSVHRGSHSNYDNMVIARLNDISPNATAEEAYNEVMDIIQDIRHAILTNPNTHINNLVF